MTARLRAYFISDPLIILLTAVFGIVSVAVSLFDKTGDRQIRVARVWARCLLGASGVRVHVEGLAHLDPSASYVFASNHLSYMDTPAALANIPLQFRFLAKRGLFQIPLLGTHLSQAGHIPVPRDDPRASVKTLQAAAEVLRQRRISMLIFPEGGRSPDGELQPFKEGAAYIAIRAGVPIVPMALHGTRGVLPFGSATPRAGAVTLRILEPIETAGLTVKDRHALTERVRKSVEAALCEAPQSN